MAGLDEVVEAERLNRVGPEITLPGEGLDGMVSDHVEPVRYECIGDVPGRLEGALLVLAETLRDDDDARDLGSESPQDLSLEPLDARAFRGDAEPQQVDVLGGRQAALLADDIQKF